jgi:hypothetical protein
MECAALCFSLRRQPCDYSFTPQVSRAPSSTVEPSHCSPTDLVENQILRSSSHWAVDVETTYAFFKPGISHASSAGQSCCLQADQDWRSILFLICEDCPSDSKRWRWAYRFDRKEELMVLSVIYCGGLVTVLNRDEPNSTQARVPGSLGVVSRFRADYCGQDLNSVV